VTDSQVAKVVDAIEIIEAMGHGSVEVIIQNGKILDIVKKERERIN
jgi:hypothetical protein